MTSKLKIGSAFSGIGGFELGIERALGERAETVWQIEKNEYCRQVLKKHWPKSKIYEDITTIDINNLQKVDILLGGFPCQDVSQCRKVNRGINGERTSLYRYLLQITCEIRPRVVVMENVVGLIRNGLDRVLGDFSEIGYCSEWRTLRASDFGASHRRERIFIVCYKNTDSNRFRLETSAPLFGRHIFKGETKTGSRIAGLSRTEIHRREQTILRRVQKIKTPSKSGLCRRSNGISGRMDKNRLMALGNAIVPACSQYVGECLLESGLLDYKGVKKT